MARNLKIYPPASKMVRSLIGSALFAAVAVWISLHSESWGNFTAMGLSLSYGLVVFFLWLFLHTLFRLLLPKPLIILSDKGLFDQSSVFAIGFIPWRDIQKIEARSAGRQRFVNIDLNNLQTYLTGLKGLKLTMMKLNLSVGHGPVKIPDSMFPMNAAVLAEQLKAYRSGVGDL